MYGKVRVKYTSEILIIQSITRHILSNSENNMGNLKIFCPPQAHSSFGKNYTKLTECFCCNNFIQRILSISFNIQGLVNKRRFVTALVHYIRVVHLSNALYNFR